MTELPIAPADTPPSSNSRLPIGGPWSPAYRRLTTGLILTLAGSAFATLAVATILPATASDLDGLGLYGWAFSAFMLTNLVGIAVAGGEADLRGPARPFLAGVVLFAIGLLIGGLAPTMEVLILGRAVQGFGGGFISSIAYVTVGRGYPETAKPRMLALMSTAWVVPGLVGPGLAGVVADVAGWRWVFLGLAPFLIAAVLLSVPAMRHIPKGSATERDRRRIGFSIQLAAGVALFLGGLNSGNLLLALPLVPAGIAVALPALRRLLPPGTLSAAPGLPVAIALMGLVNLSFFGVESFVPLMLTELRDRSSSFAGLALTAATLTWTAGSWLMDRRARRTSRRTLVRAGLLIVALGNALTTALLAPAVPVLLAPLAWGVAGLGIGIAYATLSLTVLETAPQGEEGAATIGMQLANVLGFAVGAGVGGALIAAFSEGDTPARGSLLAHDLLMIAAILLGAVLASRLPAHIGKGDESVPQSS